VRQAWTSWDPAPSLKKGPGVLIETMVGGVGALAVLALVCASFLAFMPLIMALVAIPTTFLLIGASTYVTPVNFHCRVPRCSHRLGVSIDYGLLLVTRWRGQTLGRVVGVGGAGPSQPDFSHSI
jgi:hypothetical protein